MAEITPYADLFTRLEGVRAGFNERRQTLLAERDAARHDAAQRTGRGELADAAQDRVNADFARRIKDLEEEEARVVGPMADELQRMREQKDPSLAARRLLDSQNRTPTTPDPPREPGDG